MGSKSGKLICPSHLPAHTLPLVTGGTRVGTGPLSAVEGCVAQLAGRRLETALGLGPGPDLHGEDPSQALRSKPGLAGLSIL